MLIRSGACALLLALSSCTNLKAPDQRAPDGGNAGSAGDLAGSGANGGESGAGMSGQTGGSSGMSGGSGGTSATSGGGGETGGTGGTDPTDSGTDEDADTSDGGDDAGDAATVDSEGPIAGRVIDYFENPVPDALVTLNGETVTTDEDGEFAFGPTARTYSIGVALEVARFGGAEQNGYLFVGLTRRDPTLQMYRGLPKHGGNVTRNVTGVTFPLPSTEKIAMDVAGQYGGFSAPLTSATVTGSGEWEGPAEVQGHVHAIRYVHAAASPQLPTSYLAHASQPVALDADMTASFTLDLSGDDGGLATGIISGAATGGGIGGRANDVFVRFADDAAVRVLSHGASAEAFSYLVPSIPGTSIAVAAMRSDISNPPYAVSYVEGIAPGASDVALEIPLPATLLSPGTAATDVDGDTEFTWSGDDQVVMLVFDALNYYENFYVITAEKTGKIPVDVMIPSLRPNFVYEWSVRTHRTFATVDDATGPTGYLDSFCYGRLRGPRRDSGSHTGSTLRSFTTAP